LHPELHRSSMSMTISVIVVTMAHTCNSWHMKQTDFHSLIHCSIWAHRQRRWGATCLSSGGPRGSQITFFLIAVSHLQMWLPADLQRTVAVFWGQFFRNSGSYQSLQVTGILGKSQDPQLPS
jgi:hypothetical protein